MTISKLAWTLTLVTYLYLISVQLRFHVIKF